MPDSALSFQANLWFKNCMGNMIANFGKSCVAHWDVKEEDPSPAPALFFFNLGWALNGEVPLGFTQMYWQAKEDKECHENKSHPLRKTTRVEESHFLLSLIFMLLPSSGRIRGEHHQEVIHPCNTDGTQIEAQELRRATLASFLQNWRSTSIALHRGSAQWVPFRWSGCESWICI